MSEEACTWAQRQKAGNRTAKFLLMRLAAYADAEGVVWASVPVLSGQMECDDRTVQRGLRALEKARLITRTGKFKYRNVPFYRLDMTGAARSAACANGDSLSPLKTANGDTGAALNGDTGVTQKKGNQPEVRSNDLPSGRAREGSSEIKERAYAAYPDAGRLGVSSRREFDSAWENELADGAEETRLEAAVRAYAADPKAWGSSGKPVAAHNFLSRGRWVEFADRAEQLPAIAAATGWQGPTEIRQLVINAKGEAWCGSWFDPASWNGSAVVARTRLAAGQLREVLRQFDVEVLNPP
jgi:hypothetical protein